MMKKNFKSGFTLVELLLCIAIIGVVSALGMNITKHSTAKAYKLFYYSAYTNLYDAICYAEENKAEDNDATKDSVIGDRAEFIKLLNAALGKTDNQGKTEDPENGNIITTSNGIKYTIGNPSDDKCPITMQVPQAKTKKNNGFETVNFVYMPTNIVGKNNLGSMLIPVAGGSVNLQNRKDLLPFYIDDGLNNSKEIAYFPFDEAYCRMSNNTSLSAALPLSFVETALLPEDVMFRFMTMKAKVEQNLNHTLENGCTPGGVLPNHSLKDGTEAAPWIPPEDHTCEYPGDPIKPGDKYKHPYSEDEEDTTEEAGDKVPGITVPSTLVNCGGKNFSAMRGVLRVADPRKAH